MLHFLWLALLCCIKKDQIKFIRNKSKCCRNVILSLLVLKELETNLLVLICKRSHS